MQQFDRRSARVEAMRLNDVADLRAAFAWLRFHGVTSSVDPPTLRAKGRGILIARLGQWLTFTPASGAFEVYDDDEFKTAHNAVTGVAE